MVVRGESILFRSIEAVHYFIFVFSFFLGGDHVDKSGQERTSGVALLHH